MTVHQRDLFAAGSPALATEARWQRIVLDDTSWVDLCRRAVEGADTLLDDLIERVPWRQGSRPMYDRVVADPRLSHWYRADEPAPHPLLDEMRAVLAARYRVPFGGVGLNYYRDGRDSVAPHADRELRDHDTDALVAILTVGARRPFRMRRVEGGGSLDLAPGSGDLLVMGGRCQRAWHHGVPKVARSGPRISASWRWHPTRPG